MALATSKRKFYKLLDNLSSSRDYLPHAASTSDSIVNADTQQHQQHENTDNSSRPTSTVLDSNTNTNTPDRPAKRSRMPAPGRRPRAVGGISSTTSVRLISSNFEPNGARSNGHGASPKSGSGGGGPSPARLQQSTYAPWSHEQFLERLKTFADVRTWTPKPEPVNEVQWARRGWSIVGQDEVECRTCGRRVLVMLGDESDDGRTVETGDADDDDEPKWWLAGAEKLFIAQYEKLIVEGHFEDCLWRRSGCKDDIYRIKFSDPAQWQADLAKRYHQLDAMSASLPSQIVHPHTPGSTEQIQYDLGRIARRYGPRLLADQPKDTSKTISQPKDSGPTSVPPKEPNINRTALTLALCGWTAQEISGVQIANCSKCFTRVGLWLYAPKDTSTTDDKSPPSHLPSEHDDDDIMRFDPVSLHRAHCPWQNPLSQHAPGGWEGLAGWEILIDMIANSITRADRARAEATLSSPPPVVGGDSASVFDDNDNDNATDAGKSDYSLASQDDIDKADKVREGRLSKLKRKLTVRRTLTKGSLGRWSASRTSLTSSLGRRSVGERE